MSRLERLLLLGILFFGFIRLFMMPPDDAAHPDEQANWDSDTGYGNTGSAETGQTARQDMGGGYDWNPASFTRRGIPAKLTLTVDGKVPDNLRLNDTQKAFVYAAMIETYDALLTRARTDCALDMRRDIVRWQARHARVIADAELVLDTLTPDRTERRTAHATMPSDVFTRRICPTVAHYLATGAYDPHPEAVDRLAHAARSRDAS
jgi:hypothetical protein